MWGWVSSVVDVAFIQRILQDLQCILPRFLNLEFTPDSINWAKTSSFMDPIKTDSEWLISILTRYWILKVENKSSNHIFKRIIRFQNDIRRFLIKWFGTFAKKSGQLFSDFLRIALFLPLLFSPSLLIASWHYDCRRSLVICW